VESVTKEAMAPLRISLGELPGPSPNMSAPLKEVEGKVAFITGGSSGIGLGIARAFADVGMKIVIGYRSKIHLDEALQYLDAASSRIHAINVDVTDRPGMEAAASETVQTFGKIHVLVNNAGVGVVKPVTLTTYDDWDWLIRTNLTGVFNGIHAFLPQIQTHGEGGQIITTASVMGLFTAMGHGLYSASKFAVVGLMEALRLELLESNIGVSVFCPGNVWTKLGDSSRNRPGDKSEDSAQQAGKAKHIINMSRTDGPDRAMDPLDAGRLVLRGMRDNDLYILSHPEFEPMIRERHQAIESSTPVDLQAPDARVRSVNATYYNPIYALARDWKRSVQGQVEVSS
jgi:NAD(P)-dependent dehydrogenase (short-subunit alcohol dehydrogenase family)